MEIAERLGIGPATCAALKALSGRIEPGLTDLVGAPIAEIRARGVEGTLGKDDARTFYLWLALMQVPAAERRRREAGIDPAATESTFADLAVWTRHFEEQVGARGITLEILEWAQRYLSGELVRIGSLQFEVIPFGGALRVFRSGGALSAVSTDGRAIDLKTGEVTDERGVEHDAEHGEVVLAPGMPVLDLHIPADSTLTFAAMLGSIRQAFTIHAEKRPACVCGEAWLLDPQVRALLPHHQELHAIQRACSLYPSRLPEAATIRRLFGPDITRAELVTLPQDAMTSLQRAVAELLSDPRAELRARGGFLHLPELALLEDLQKRRAAPSETRGAERAKPRGA